MFLKLIKSIPRSLLDNVNTVTEKRRQADTRVPMASTLRAGVPTVTRLAGDSAQPGGGEEQADVPGEGQGEHHTRSR